MSSDCYFEEGEYLKAFNLKQELRASEQKYGFPAFIGAGRLQPKHQITNPSLALVEQQETIAQEIAATGREQDIKRIVERMGCADRKLTIIYGQSGVGKSSILQAGLIPVLTNRAIGTRDVVPVLQQVYPDWIRELGDRLAEALNPLPVNPFGFVKSQKSKVNQILNQLQTNADNELLTVLIFDQFEEFFFVYKDPKQRLIFYNFLRECLDVPHVRVILSLREDYLYYLLECNDRLTNLEVINNNILDKDILYYLGNFSREDTKALIQSFTQTTKLFLEQSLIEALVEDLAGDFGEIRPIELQVVGTQLQTDKITTLEQYREHGPKEKLVGLFLEEVVKDCGVENEQIAKLVLYLLTDENNTRPLKTRADLELELDLKSETLDLVLLILVKSGLVFKVPAVPADRYQLVHNYLVPFVRQQQSSRLIAELEKEREQRKLTEAKLNQVLTKQLQDARRATITLAGLVAVIGAVAVTTTIVGINLFLSNLSLASEQNTELDRVISALKAGRELKKWSIAAIPETKLRIVTELNRAVYGVREISRLKGHAGSVTSVSFSANGQLLATVSEDKTVKIWRIDGSQIANLKRYADAVTSVIFSPDNQTIATTSVDKTVKLWKIDGTFIKTLKGHTGAVTSASFSRDGKMLVSASEDKTIKLWNLEDSKVIKTLKGHDESVIGVSLSPDDKILASASKDDTIKLWSVVDGKEIKTIDNYGATSIRFSADGQSIISLNKDGTIKLWALDGTYLKNLNQYSGLVDITTISLSPDGTSLAFVSPRLGNEKSIQVYYSNEFKGHSDKITYLSFSPDGRILASASKDKTVKLWSFDSKASNFIWEDRVEKFYDQNMRFSLDGKTILTTNDDNSVKLWSINGNFIKNLHKYDSQPSFSHDGKTIITSNNDDILEVWSLDRKENIRLLGYSGSVSNINFSPNGKLITAVSGDNTINFWRSDGTLIKTWKGINDNITKLVFSLDSKLIASIGNNNLVNLWSSDGNLIQTLKGHTSNIREVLFSPDSKCVVSIDENNVAKLWRSNGTPITTLKRQHPDGIAKVLFSPDSKLIASVGDDNLVNLWSIDGSLIQTLKGHTDKITSVSFSRDSRVVASLSSSGESSTIKLWKRDDNFTKPIDIDNYGVISVQFSPDSSILASINKDKTVKLWNRDGTKRATLKGYNDTVTSVSFSPDSKLVVSGSKDNTVKIWSSDGKLLKILRGHKDGINNVSFSPDGNIITSISTSKNEDSKGIRYTVNLWSKDGKGIKTIEGLSEKPHELSANFDGKLISDGEFVTSVSNFDFIGEEYNHIPHNVGLSLDGKIVISVNQDSKSNYTVNFSGSDGKELKSLQGKGVSNFNFSPDGRTAVLTTQKNHSLTLWSIDSTLLATIKGYRDSINSASLSPDSKMIASAGDDNTVKLWKRDGTPINTLKGHTEKVNGVIFSPEGKMIASASDDNTVKLWKRDGTPIKTLEEHTDKVNGVIFSPDGKIIASASDDNTVKLWTRDGTFIKNIEAGVSDIDSLSFSPDSQILAIANNNINQYGSVKAQIVVN